MECAACQTGSLDTGAAQASCCAWARPPAAKTRPPHLFTLLPNSAITPLRLRFLASSLALISGPLTSSVPPSATRTPPWTSRFALRTHSKLVQTVRTLQTPHLLVRPQTHIFLGAHHSSQFTHGPTCFGSRLKVQGISVAHFSKTLSSLRHVLVRCAFHSFPSYFFISHLFSVTGRRQSRRLKKDVLGTCSRRCNW